MSKHDWNKQAAAAYPALLAAYEAQESIAYRPSFAVS